MIKDSGDIEIGPYTNFFDNAHPELCTPYNCRLDGHSSYGGNAKKTISSNGDSIIFHTNSIDDGVNGIPDLLC